MLADTLKSIDDSTTVRLPDMTNVFLVLLMNNSDVYKSKNLLCPINDVIWSEPNDIIKPMAAPNDTRYNNQWNLKSIDFGINAERAWDITQGSPTVNVGVIGSGIDASNPDLTGKILGGYNYHYFNNNWGDDGTGHETKVTGIIAARTNNGIGVAGIAGGWNRDPNDIGSVIYSLRATDNDGIMQAVDMANAIVGGVDDFNCDIINISWGGGYNELRHEAVAYAQSQRKLIVAAIGNGGYGDDDHYVYPGQHEDSWIISMGAYGQDGIYCQVQCPCRSNFGGNLDVVAPGANLVTTAPGSNYTTDFGCTSGATPHGAGAAALILSVMGKSLWSEDIDWIIKRTALPPPNGDYLHYGSGYLGLGNIFNTLLSPTHTQGVINYYGEYLEPFSITFIEEAYWHFYNPGPIPEGRYDTKRYEVVYHVTFSDAYDFMTGAWGKRYYYDQYGDLYETDGWSAANRNIQEGYCQVVPGTLTPYGCDIKNNFYQIYVNNQWIWKPFNPNNQPPFVCYAIWGTKAAGDPTRPGGGKLDLSNYSDFPLECYPNPFNANVTINYDLADDSYINIDIFDVLGRSVKKISEGIQKAGSHNIIWNSTDNYGNILKSGVYFISFRSNETHRIKKIVLLK